MEVWRSGVIVLTIIRLISAGRGYGQRGRAFARRRGLSYSGMGRDFARHSQILWRQRLGHSCSRSHLQPEPDLRWPAAGDTLRSAI